MQRADLAQLRVARLCRTDGQAIIVCVTDDDMHGLDHLDAETETRLANAATARYAADCAKAALPAKAVHKASVDAVEVVLEDAKQLVLARYPWIYDAVVGMARLK
jgi:uncharacterized membrane protein